MQSMTTHRTNDPDAASNGIRIDGVLLLTGTLGFFFLSASYFLPLALAVHGAYLAIVGKALDVAVVVMFVTTIVCALVWSVPRWIARGLLEGRKARAIIACILMIASALINLGAILGGLLPANASDAIASALILLVLSLLLIASFRNRHYWGRAR